MEDYIIDVLDGRRRKRGRPKGKSKTRSYRKATQLSGRRRTTSLNRVKPLSGKRRRSRKGKTAITNDLTAIGLSVLGAIATVKVVKMLENTLTREVEDSEGVTSKVPLIPKNILPVALIAGEYFLRRKIRNPLLNNALKGSMVALGMLAFNQFVPSDQVLSLSGSAQDYYRNMLNPALLAARNSTTATTIY